MDKYRLEYEIKRKGMGIGDFCDRIGMSRVSFWRRCNGKLPFTVDEVRRIVDILEIDDPMPIFFAEKVSEKKLEEE